MSSHPSTESKRPILSPPSPQMHASPEAPRLRKTSPPPPKDIAASSTCEPFSDTESRARARFRSKSPSLTRSDDCQAPASTTAQKSNGFLSPPPASWRSFSRSPSPLGLIPIHQTFRQLVHRHEVPRKVLHVSIGFLVLHLYKTGVQPATLTPGLGYALIPIVSADLLRFVSPSFNWLYIRVLGALMRESEFSGWNGVIWYMIGTWTVLAVFPKDIATLSILLLSWCDTAASTFGRLFGRYTPQIRKGKSFAGSLAAFMVGSAATAYFYGRLVPDTPLWPNDPTPALSYFGGLHLPVVGEVGGSIALGIVSVVTGLIGSVSELTDVWGLDDNVVIPVLSAAGIWGFLRVFAA
ncbi:hypothetical protein TWF788_006285 [Orbilia oligospora]|uniref:Phosphatidate cytidylyltransferase n=1 Tax=Orbilia oligospora TaxID=2813651 RepID=A0A7C8PWT6_ORBOL|nr:hypothetical protein TWF788_006285 [Orbilia oligospora]